MHWLRDLMEESPTRVRSLGELARQALAHPGWPPRARAQERSLAALFSKLDRGLELEWLADRPEVQQVLADVLGGSPARIAAALSSVAKSGGEPTRVRLFDLPFAAPLD